MSIQKFNSQYSIFNSVYSKMYFLLYFINTVVALLYFAEKAVSEKHP